MNRALRTLAGTVPTLLLVLGGTAAQAATWTHSDARGDATLVDIDAETGEQEYRANEGDASADITRVTVRHLPRRLVLSAQVADLRRDDASSLIAMLQTPSGRYAAVAGGGSGSLTFVLVPLRDRPHGVSCSGGAVDIDAATDTIRLTIPRSCLDNPSWVRAGFQTLTGDMGLLGSPLTNPASTTMSTDDALRTGGHAQRFTLGPKVRVG